MTSSTWESESDAPRTAVTLLTSWMGAPMPRRVFFLFEGLSAFKTWLSRSPTTSHVSIDDMPERTGSLIRSCVKSAFLSRLDGGIRCYGACRQLVSYCQWVL